MLNPAFLRHTLRRGLVLLALVLAAAPLAQAAADDAARAAVAKLAPGLPIDAIQESVVPGFYEVLSGVKILYVSKDGKLVFEGGAFDVDQRRDLGDTARNGVRRAALTQVPAERKLIYAPAKPRHTVTVFTDIDCPFCKRFHEQIAQYNAHGIAVDYILFPLVGLHPGADKKSEAIWCSKDRIATFNAAMAGQDPAPATCPNPLAELTHLADSLGINGTPTLIAADGTHVAPEIAMSPDRLAAELDRLAAASAP
jgi:thiol:disulfide interchange protein DsbC